MLFLNTSLLLPYEEIHTDVLLQLYTVVSSECPWTTLSHENLFRGQFACAISDRENQVAGQNRNKRDDNNN